MKTPCLAFFLISAAAHLHAFDGFPSRSLTDSVTPADPFAVAGQAPTSPGHGSPDPFAGATVPQPPAAIPSGAKQVGAPYAAFSIELTARDGRVMGFQVLDRCHGGLIAIGNPFAGPVLVRWADIDEEKTTAHNARYAVAKKEAEALPPDDVVSAERRLREWLAITDLSLDVFWPPDRGEPTGGGVSAFEIMRIIGTKRDTRNENAIKELLTENGIRPVLEQRLRIGRVILATVPPSDVTKAFSEKLAGVENAIKAANQDAATDTYHWPVVYGALVDALPPSAPDPLGANPPPELRTPPPSPKAWIKVADLGGIDSQRSPDFTITGTESRFLWGFGHDPAENFGLTAFVANLFGSHAQNIARSTTDGSGVSTGPGAGVYHVEVTGINAGWSIEVDQR